MEIAPPTPPGRDRGRCGQAYSSHHTIPCDLLPICHIPDFYIQPHCPDCLFRTFQQGMAVFTASAKNLDTADAATLPGAALIFLRRTGRASAGTSTIGRLLLFCLYIVLLNNFHVAAASGLIASKQPRTFSKNKCPLCSIAAPTFIEGVATI